MSSHSYRPRSGTIEGWFLKCKTGQDEIVLLANLFYTKKPVLAETNARHQHAQRVKCCSSYGRPLILSVSVRMQLVPLSKELNNLVLVFTKLGPDSLHLI